MGEDFNMSYKDFVGLISNNIHRQKYETIHRLIEYLRKKQIAFLQDDKETVSGVDLLYSLVTNGTIRMQLMINILPAIENPFGEYELEGEELTIKPF